MRNLLALVKLKIAFITYYCEEDVLILSNCIRSVAGQSYTCHHFVVAEGHPAKWLGNVKSVSHVKLDKALGDNGNTPIVIGTPLAASENHDGIRYLDADSWYDKDHVKQFVNCISNSDLDNSKVVNFMYNVVFCLFPQKGRDIFLHGSASIYHQDDLHTRMLHVGR